MNMCSFFYGVVLMEFYENDPLYGVSIAVNLCMTEKL